MFKTSFSNFLERQFGHKFKQTMLLSNLKEVKEFDFNKYNKQMFLDYKYYTNNNDFVARINYCPETGQIGFLYTDQKYQRQGLGTQLVMKASKDVKTNELWLFGDWDNPFYKNAFNGAFRKRSPADDSISGSGWRIYVNDIINFK